jgi:hypothetical protein
MKKIVSKTGNRSLALSKTTVRELSHGELVGVGGGGTRTLSGCNQTVTSCLTCEPK